MAQALDLEKMSKIDLPTPKLWCWSCCEYRLLTANSKCLTCGSKILLPSHFGKTLKLVDVISRTRNEFTHIEILGKLYFIPHELIDLYLKIQSSNITQKAKFVERIKKCHCIKV